MKIFCKFLLYIFFISSAFAKDVVYRSLKFNEVNSRSGPKIDFPVLYIYKLRGMPVKVIGEYDKWFKIVDKDGDSGWVSEHLLSKTRMIIVIKDGEMLYSNYNDSAYPISKIEKNVVAKLVKCKSDRCKIKIGKIKGWVNESAIWGVE